MGVDGETPRAIAADDHSLSLLEPVRRVQLREDRVEIVLALPEVRIKAERIGIHWVRTCSLTRNHAVLLLGPWMGSSREPVKLKPSQ